MIRPALEVGRFVVCDRFLLSSVVYQGHGGNYFGAGYGDEIDEEQIWDMGRLATNGIKPDLTIVLDLPVDVAQSRRTRPPDRMESRYSSYYAWMREGFLVEARRRPQEIRVVDASGPIESVQQHIRKEVEGVLAAHSRT